MFHQSPVAVTRPSPVQRACNRQLLSRIMAVVAALLIPLAGHAQHRVLFIGNSFTGDNSGFGALNAANNVTNTATVAQIRPNASGEITISLAPTANDNNANHYTYPGALRIDPKTPAPQFLPAVISGGQLQWSSSLPGQWTDVLPTPSSPYSEPVVAGEGRFFRVRKP